MYGLIVLIVISLYITGCVGMVWLTVKQGKKREWKYTWLWGLLVFLLYNTPLGLYVIPPMVAMDRYCEESGFWLYKTPEQWMAENPGVAETLVVDGSQINRKLEGKAQRIFHLNQRFDWFIESSYTQTKNVNKETQTILDRETGEVMAKRIDFMATAYPIYAPQTCFDKSEREKWGVDGKSMSKYIGQFQGLGEKK